MTDIADIVERLRARANDTFIRDHPLMAEAADEIERLTAALRKIVAFAGPSHPNGVWACEVARAALSAGRRDD